MQRCVKSFFESPGSAVAVPGSAQKGIINTTTNTAYNLPVIDERRDMATASPSYSVALLVVSFLVPGFLCSASVCGPDLVRLNVMAQVNIRL
jgi:hypothetical protein